MMSSALISNLVSNIVKKAAKVTVVDYACICAAEAI